VKARYAKRLLPNYDVFDEQRYFEAGDRACVIEHHGKKIFLTICEDIWAQSSDPRIPGRYEKDPLDDFGSADLLLNLSASPYERSKDRISLVQTIAQKLKKPVVQVTQVGVADSMIFAGESIAVDSRGMLISYLPAYEEAESSLDLSSTPTPVDRPQPQSIERLYDTLVFGLRDFVTKSGFSSVVLGLSGGIDSALVACLAEDAFGGDRVRLVLLPSRYTSSISNIDAVEIAKVTRSPLHILSIEAVFPAVLQTLESSFEGLEPNTTEENLQSRIRGMLLMALSNKFGDFLLACGNKSELAMGYCTLYGDMCGGLAPIADLYKTQVYELAREANRRKKRIPERIFTREPSAELRPDQRDTDSLPPYEILDEILRLFIEESRSVSEIIAQGFESSVVLKIIHKVSSQEFKRQQSAPVLKLSSKAFGLGRRHPIIQSTY
jgi:NAD+ synthetase